MIARKGFREVALWLVIGLALGLAGLLATAPSRAEVGPKHEPAAEPMRPENPGTTERVSVASDGTEGNADSLAGFVSEDGRYVVFVSAATNLAAKDTNSSYDVFIHDRELGETALISVASDGTQGNSHSRYASVSGDGRFVAFESWASNLVEGDDTSWSRDVFVRDRQSGQTSRVLVTDAGAGLSNAHGISPTISVDGRYVALVSGPWHQEDVFVHDRQTGQATRVSVASDGTPGNEYSWYPSISADGRFVAFQSMASNLADSDAAGWDVFVHDRQTGQTTCVSVASNGSNGNSHSVAPSISSGDGRYVAFVSSADKLVPGDTNGRSDVFVHDRQISQTTRVSVASNGSEGDGNSGLPSISADGRYVVFPSIASNLVEKDTPYTWDLFVHDRQTGQTTRVAKNTPPQVWAHAMRQGSISGDGRYVGFSTLEGNLVAGDTNNSCVNWKEQASSKPCHSRTNRRLKYLRTSS